MKPTDPIARHRPSRRHTIIATILAVVLVLTAVTFVPWLYYVGQGKRAVQEKLRELRSAGYVMTLEEVHARYHDPSLDPEKNAAPFYEEAFAQMERGREANEAIDRIREAFMALEPGEALPEEARQEAAELLERNAGALALLKEAAGQPYARFDIDFTEGYELLIPHVGQLRQGMRLLSLEAMQHGLNGEGGKATEALDAGLAIAAHLVVEPTILSQLVRIVVIGIVLDTLEWLTERQRPDVTALEVIGSRLQWHDANPGMPIGLEAEMAFGNSLFTGSPLDFFEDDDFGEEKWLALFHVLSGRIHHDHSFYLHAMEDQVKVLRKPMEDWMSHHEKEWASEAHEKGYLLSAIFVPATSGLQQTEVHSVARIRIHRILLALERYRNEEGHLPEKLDALAPRFFDELPVDPVYGNPFVVNQEEEWLVLESAGQMRQGPDLEERPIRGRIRR